MNQNVNSNMIILARESRGYTQKKLSKLLDVTQGRISKIEQGILMVPEDLLNKLCDKLGYPKGFFFEPAFIYSPISPFHRKRKSLPKKIQCQIEAEANIRRIHVNKLLRSAEIVDSKIFYQDIEDFNITPEEVALKLRHYWKIPQGPINNVTKTLEDAGIIIIHCDFGTSLTDGFSFFVEDKPPIIFVNKNMPGDRLRFTLAHELGHIIMHCVPTPTMEEEANKFASEFLMPEKEIKSYLSKLSLQKLANLKRRWKVSMAALIMRATTISAITQNQAQYLWMQLGKAGYRRKEPIEISKETPTIVKQLISLHLRDLEYTMAQLSKMLLCEMDEFINLYMDRNLRIVKS